MANIHAANTDYPGVLDTAATLLDDTVPGDGTGTVIKAIQQNGPASAVVAIETTLGTNPQGSVLDVATRISKQMLATGAPKDAGGGAFTAGSVVFCATSGGDVLFQEDNLNFFWDDSSNRLGIGTTIPSVPLVVQADTSAFGIRVRGRAADNLGQVAFRNNADSGTNIGYIEGTNTALMFGYSNELMQLRETGLTVLPVGPHAIGGATNTQHQLLLTGAFTGSISAYGLVISSSLTATPGGDIYGIRLEPTLIESASGVHPLIAGIYVAPLITAGAGTVTNADSIHVEGFTAAAGTTNASGLKIVNAPTGATNNYALWVAAGNARFAAAIGSNVNPVVGPSVDFSDATMMKINSGTTAIQFVNQSGATERMRLTDGGILALGTTVVTGANGGDDVLANAKSRRFVTSGGATSANYGIDSSATDDLFYGVPAATDLHRFLFIGNERLQIKEQNSGAGIMFVGEASADHSTPAANNLIGYSLDDGAGNTIFAVQNSGGVPLYIAPAVAPATPKANTLYRDSIMKGWVVFDVAGTIDDDLNVSSITDNGAGDWTVNWATAFANANYCPSLTLQAEPQDNGDTFNQDAFYSPMFLIDPSNNPTTSALRVTAWAGNNNDTQGAATRTDPVGTRVRMYVSAIGDN